MPGLTPVLGSPIQSPIQSPIVGDTFAAAVVLAWPYPFTATKDVSGQGSSTMSAPYLPAPLNWLYTTEGTGYTAYFINGSSPGAGGVFVMNWGSGGKTATQIEVIVAASPARVKAAYTVIQLCGNYESVAGGPVPTIITKAIAIAGDLGHTNFTHIPKHYDGNSIASSGGLDWHRIREVTRQLGGTGGALGNCWPGQTHDPNLWFKYIYTPRDGTDAADQVKSNVPTSLWGGTPQTNHTDNSHLCGDDVVVGYTSGNHLLDQYAYAVGAESRETGGLPEIGHSRIFSGDASLNQANGGRVCAIAYNPNGAAIAGGTVSITNDSDFSVAIEGSEIVVRRATGTFISDSFRVLYLKFTRDGKSRISYHQVFLGDITGSNLYRANLNQQWIVKEGIIGGVSTGQQLSMAIGIKPAGTWGAANAKGLYVTDLGTAGGINCAVKASANQNIGTTVRNTADQIIVNFDTPTAQGFTIANGLRWFFFGVDLIGNVGRVAVDANAAVSMTGVAGPTAAGNQFVNSGTMAIYPAADIDILNVMFATATAGSNPCDAEVAAVWVANGYVDWTSTTTNRDKVRDPATGRSLLATTRGGDGPGVVAGVSACHWMQGVAGNWGYGLNLASYNLTSMVGFWDATDRAMITSVAA